VYQNVTASAVSDPNEIKKKFNHTIDRSCKMDPIVQQMIADGATLFTEVGPGKLLV
jgi:[acyl-carrier-protein] S-malonyltransferase